MSRLLRRNPPCRGCRDCVSDSEDDHSDERLDQLRRALHHFAIGVDTPSESDESEEEDHRDEEDDHRDEEEDHRDEEDDHSDERLGQLREALFALAQHYTSEDDESESESGQGENEAPP